MPAIFVSCLGLFGPASFVAARRTKEIGVRKVLGASVFDLWRLLSKDFVVLVFISLLVAVPVAYYFSITGAELPIQNQFIVVDFCCNRRWCAVNSIVDGDLSKY